MGRPYKRGRMDGSGVGGLWRLSSFPRRKFVSKGQSIDREKTVEQKKE